ncbi:hypothetical protein E2C01_069087 [Portunus trituberculatus]|uniref:Uncharacterized protein n=1 Tax=Portunus trituberculatus TaxID=210409 RepID=A0A5B7HXN0_PORTR|nr:hypothetical protein [Portunus trituberculatus]
MGGWVNATVTTTTCVPSSPAPHPRLVLMSGSPISLRSILDTLGYCGITLFRPHLSRAPRVLPPPPRDMLRPSFVLLIKENQINLD